MRVRAASERGENGTEPPKKCLGAQIWLWSEDEEPQSHQGMIPRTCWCHGNDLGGLPYGEGGDKIPAAAPRGGTCPVLRGADTTSNFSVGFAGKKAPQTHSFCLKFPQRGGT